jgi:Domain of unknown function (DUF1980).
LQVKKSVKIDMKNERNKKVRRFNFDEFLCFIIFILLDISLIYLTVTGKIDFYVGKKMIIYIYITIVMMSIMIIFQLQNIVTFKRNSNLKMKLLPILFTIILGEFQSIIKKPLNIMN